MSEDYVQDWRFFTPEEMARLAKSEPQRKCKGCGRKTDNETDWCYSCRTVLYTPLQILRVDFSSSEFKAMMFPVRDIIWMQDRVRLRDDEIKQMDRVNDDMAGEVARLRQELAYMTARSEAHWRCLREIRKARNEFIKDEYQTWTNNRPQDKEVGRESQYRRHRRNG